MLFLNLGCDPVANCGNITSCDNITCIIRDNRLQPAILDPQEIRRRTAPGPTSQIFLGRFINSAVLSIKAVSAFFCTK